jgi:tetratricopeptide (TPR) repeat protein
MNQNNKIGSLIILVLVVFMFDNCSLKTSKKEYQSKAIEYLQKNDNINALNYINKAIDIDSADDVSFVIKGRIENILNNYQDALNCFNIALELNKSNTAAYYHKAMSLYLLSRYDSAIYYFNSSIKTKGSDTLYIDYKNLEIDKNGSEDIPMADIRYFRGLSYYYQNNFIAALRDFLFCETVNYNLKQTYLYIGNIYLKYDKVLEGCLYLRKADSLNNDLAERYINQFCK